MTTLTQPGSFLLSMQSLWESTSPSLPRIYASLTGCIILAYSAHPSITSNPNSTPIPIGCVGLRPLPTVSAEEKVCEMKRLYCVPEARKSGVGKALAKKAMEAEKLGYGEMRLDTLPSLVEARILYEKLGFEEIDAYYDTLLEGTIFMAKNIGANLGKKKFGD